MARGEVFFTDKNNKRHQIDTQEAAAIQSGRLRFETIDELRAHFKTTPLKEPWLLGGKSTQVQPLTA